MASARRGQGDSPEECPVCWTVFDDSAHRPRTLPCGHTVCTVCIEKLKQQRRVACPECRFSHAVPEGGQFPVSYITEALIRRLRDVTATAAASPPSAGKDKDKGTEGSAGRMGAVGVSRELRSFLEEQEAKVVVAITACWEAQSQLEQYEAALTGWGERQQQLEDGLQGLMDQARRAGEHLRQETSSVAAKKGEVKEREQELQAVLEALHTPATEQEALKAVGEAWQCTGKAEQVLGECQQCFPDASILTTASKVREAASAALEAAQAVQADLETASSEEPGHQSVPGESGSQSEPEESGSQSEPDLTILEKVQSIMEPSLKAEDLRSLTQDTRRLLQAGRVLAVHQVEVQRRHARISLEAGRPCLHALGEHRPPRGATTLQVSQVVPPSPPCTVFLDLSWPGRSPRRVHIRLSPDTQRGRLFLALCTGQRGPSYRGTRLYKVWEEGRPGELVWGGDYESNDGEGVCVLLPGLEDGEDVRPLRAGEVWGCGRQGVFGITTRDSEDVWGLQRCVFGEVVEGLHVVAEAAHHRDIKEVTVMDCGVVV